MKTSGLLLITIVLIGVLVVLCFVLAADAQAGSFNRWATPTQQLKEVLPTLEPYPGPVQIVRPVKTLP